MSRAGIGAAAVLALLAGLGGCGGEKFTTAVIKGTVTCNGQPVPGGRLTFAPIGDEGQAIVGPGRIAMIQPDGTYRTEAVVGRVNVIFTRPDADAEDIAELEEEAAGSGETAEDARAELEEIRRLADVPCNAAAEREISIIAGENTVDIELVRRDTREFD